MGRAEGRKVASVSERGDARSPVAGARVGTPGRRAALLQFVLGRRLSNREAETRKIGVFEGVPAMGLDALGSTAYGPEAALAVLAPLGLLGTEQLKWAMAPTLLLLVLLFASYRQTIRAYPSNGGAYRVAKENLGTGAGLLAAAALMIDYVLNVAVGISAGVGALVSALPALHEYTLSLCLGILLAIVLANLRGTRESGRAFALPTYLFVASFAAIVVLGIYKSTVSGGHPSALAAVPTLGVATESASAWLLLRAIASGCSALTGIEAVSNGIGAFRQPALKHGGRTLAFIVITLGLLIAGVCYLAPVYRIGAMDQTHSGYRTVLSQLAGAIVGEGAFYYVALSALLCVLVLSANTSFVGFPRLCRTVAEDGFLPKNFALAGRRLVYSIGILYLAACAALLLIVFRGITDRLIPLFAIGAFLSFTLSQSAMVLHWYRALRRERRGLTQRALALGINAFGALATGVALAIIIVAKFAEGAWITLLVVPLVIAVLHGVRRYYARLDARASSMPVPEFGRMQPPIVVVAVEDLNQVGMKGIVFGMHLSPDVIAVHLTDLQGPGSEQHDTQLRRRWECYVEQPARYAGVEPPPLLILPAQRRTLHGPLLRLVGKIETEFPQRHVAVLIPELVKRRWYQKILHTHRARTLYAQLVKHGDARLTIVSVPWRPYEAARTIR